MKFVYIFLLILFFLIGCGGSSEPVQSITDNNTTQTISPLGSNSSITEEDLSQSFEVVGTDELTKPTISSDTFVITDDVTAGFVVGNIYIADHGSSVIENFSMSGEGSENFSIDYAGQITIRDGAILNAGKNPTYTLSVSATNSVGTSDSVTITIQVKKEIYITFGAATSPSVSEGTYEVMPLVATAKYYPISYSIIAGMDNAKFMIDSNQKLKFKTLTDFEYPQDKDNNNIYDVQIKVSDDKGHELIQTIHVKVTNIDDVAPVIQDATFTIGKSISKNSIVGALSIAKGDSAITKYSLSGNSNFVIDSYGVIKTASTISLDALSYVLHVSATNGAGVSNRAKISIYVEDNNPNIQGIVETDFLTGGSVKIYKINSNATYTKLYTQTIDANNRFDTQSSILEDDAFYLYQATVGLGKSETILRAIVKGSWFNRMHDDDFHLSALTELHFINSVDAINNSFANLDSQLVVEARTLLSTDINLDGTIDSIDILMFDPDSDQNILSQKVLDSLNNIGDVTPKVITSVKTLNARDVVLSSDEKKVYIADGKDGLKIMDVSDTLNPVLLSSIDTNFAMAMALSPDGSTLYIADRFFGLKIIDVRNPLHPAVVGSFYTNYAFDVALSLDGKTAYIADNLNGLKIVDVTNPSSPILLSTLDTKNASGVSLSSDNTKAYLADGDSGGLKIIDIADSSNPTLLGQIALKKVWSVTPSLDDTKAYVATENLGMKIIDVSDATQPKQLSSFNTNNARSVVLTHDQTKAYIPDYNAGIKIVDITDATRPALLESVDIDGSAIGVILSKDNSKAYVADDEGHLKILNVNNLNNLIAPLE